jgi:4-hydroxy-3-methylbut-2-enyl diphosphate reductase IspH
VAAFLEQSAICRVISFQYIERCQRIGYPVHVSLADRNHVEQIAVLGYFPQQGLARAQYVRELAAVEVRAHAQELCLDA